MAARKRSITPRRPLKKDPEEEEEQHMSERSRKIERLSKTVEEKSLAPQVDQTSRPIKKRSDAWMWGLAIVIFVAVLIGLIVYMIWRKKAVMDEDIVMAVPEPADCETLQTEVSWQPTKRKNLSEVRIGVAPSASKSG